MKASRHSLITPPNFPDGYSLSPSSGVIYYRARVKGRPIKFSTGSKTIKEAKRFVENKLLEMLSDNPIKATRDKLGVTNPALSDLWLECLAERESQKGSSTMIGYDVSWRHSLEGFWGNKTVDDVSASAVKKFEVWYMRNHGERVFFNTAKHLNMFFNFLHREGHITSVPKLSDLDEVIRTKSKKEDVGRVYSAAEIKALLENATDERVKIGVLIYRYMGARKNEILKSELSKWDIKAQVAKLWSFKNKAWREVPIPTILLPELKAWIKALPAGSKFLFPSTDPEKFLASQVFDKAWKETKRLANISGWDIRNAARIHDLRHTFATQTATDGWPIAVACKVLDMTADEYMKTYVHITSGDIKKWMSMSFEVSK